MAIDRLEIIKNLREKFHWLDNYELIDNYNYKIATIPSALLNSFSRKLILETKSDLVESMEYMLISSSQESSYFTLQEAMETNEWKEIVAPNLSKKWNQEDVIHSLCAFVSSFGYCDFEPTEFIARKRLVVRANHYYEAGGIECGLAPRPQAYMLTGLCAAIMDIVCGGPYDFTLRTGFASYTARQTKAIECGDEYGEFIVERTKKQ